MGKLKLEYNIYLFTGDKYNDLKVEFPTDKGRLMFKYEYYRNGKEEAALYLNDKFLKPIQIKNFPNFFFKLSKFLKDKLGDRLKVKTDYSFNAGVAYSWGVVENVEFSYEEILSFIEDIA